MFYLDTNVYNIPKGKTDGSTNMLYCGQDSFFVSRTRKSMGVCDGVGGWIVFNIDSAYLAREMCILMNLSDDDPYKMIVNAYNDIIKYRRISAGGTTACVVTLDNSILKFSNIGDSRFIIIRGEIVVYESPIGKVVDTPYQLTIIPDGFMWTSFIMRPESSHFNNGQVGVFEGDMIIMATDGLWDNCSYAEIIDCVKNMNNSNNDYIPSRTIPEVLCEKAQKNNRKPDDITIIVSYIKSDML